MRSRRGLGGKLGTMSDGSGTAVAPSPVEPPTPPVEAPEKKGLRLPSAYTILFILIVLAAIATWIVPAGVYKLNATTGEPIPGTYHEVASHPAKILTDSLTAPINGLYGIENT